MKSLKVCFKVNLYSGNFNMGMDTKTFGMNYNYMVVVMLGSASFILN